MKTKVINLYNYNEASNELKEKILSNYSDINTEHTWWDLVYEDTENIGLLITSFDLDRNNFCKGELLHDLKYTIESILDNHGKECETFKIALKYKELNENFDNENCDYEDFKNDFCDELSNCYLQILKNEYDYKTSKEAIEDTLINDEYYFNESGKIDY